jgi:hypothetical protein
MHSSLETRKYRWVVSFTLSPLYPQGNNHQCLSDRRLGGRQRRSVCGGERRNFWSHRNRTSVVQPVANHFTDLVRFKAFATVKIHIVIFCIITPCILVGVCQHFNVTLCFHPKDGGSMFLRNVGNAYRITRHNISEDYNTELLTFKVSYDKG